MTIYPTPEQAGALRQLGMLRTDELPMLAAQWLVELDSPALRRLAGLDGSDGWLIDKVWPQVLDELGAAKVVSEVAWNLAITFQMAAWRAGDVCHHGCTSRGDSRLHRQRLPASRTRGWASLRVG
ncbi:MAG: hypothetical protein ACTHMS_16730 [Jatrophihabitans sp.]|uniref:hypothetical protein n=1 Tax=Jatrophihabitans sp. TaxID=1932789 RepID=UPI003F7CE840